MTTLENPASAAHLSPAHEGQAIAQLTPEQRAEFDRNGFLIIEDALNEQEVEHYLSVVKRLDKDITVNVGGHHKNTVRKPGEHLELRNAVAHAPEIRDLMVHPSTFPLVAQLMSGHLTLTTSHVLIRPISPKGTQRSHKQAGWHRDGHKLAHEQNGICPWLYTKIGYFLTDTTIPDCGALRVIPGSHRYNGDFPVSANGEEPYGAIEVGVKPGTAVIFDNRVWHAVGPNFSTLDRLNIYMGYCWRYLRAIDFIEQDESIKEACTPIQRQLLGDATSSLGYYLPSGEDTPLVDWLNQIK